MALSGRFRSALVIGLQGIRARKLRTFLSMISLFLGVLAVIVVQTSSVLANRELLTDIELSEGKDGTVVISMPPNEQTAPVVLDALRGRADAVGVVETNAIIGEPGVTPINPGAMPLKYADQGGGATKMICDNNMCYPEPSTEAPPPRGQAIEVRLVALTGDIRPFRPFPTVSGSWLDFTGAASFAPRLVLNNEAADAFTRYRLPAEMRMDSARAHSTPQVIGTIHDGQAQPTVYMRLDELVNWIPASTLGTSSGLTVLRTQSAGAVEQYLQAKLSPTSPFFPRTVDSRERIGGQLDMMRWIFYGMAALVLLIGIAGILNVGLATVGERVEEFALRRAVGTPRLLLAGIVLAETLIIGLLTAATAIGTGVVGLQLGSRLFGGNHPSLQNVGFPWEAGVAGVAAGLVAGILGGLLPAIRAARIPIATVMRA
ncbi:ABC transporter permease [Actinokineospora inagensis]|uniref:ABC transporter permease n=1 Tax=Actinokineospora inagensis TaxID=103730 RepID=UPI0003FBCC49|nr:ABC transporter permease [Actinokineospora inagensis]